MTALDGCNAKVERAREHHRALMQDVLDWLIPVGELKRYLAERREQPRTQRRRAARSGRKPALPAEVLARIRREHAQGASLGEIARRLNRDDNPTGQGGRQWWRSTVRAVLVRSSPPGSARAAGA